MYQREKTIFIRAYCSAGWEPSPRGCAGLGPRGDSVEEAQELSLEAGWLRESGNWICPAHAESRDETNKSTGKVGA